MAYNSQLRAVAAQRAGAEVIGVTIHHTPARHCSGRKGMDNSTLWASWMRKGPSRSVYCSADTGYAAHFGDIRKRLGAHCPQLLDSYPLRRRCARHRAW